MSPEEPPVQLAKGHTSPRLICIPAFINPSGAIQFSQLAHHLDSRRDVWCIPHPGYRHGTRLVRELHEFISSHAHSIASTGDSPFALLGFSAGGWVAHMLAEHLESIGRRPVGVILLDSYDFHQLSPRLLNAVQTSVVPIMQNYGVPDVCITAAEWYSIHSGFLTRWEPKLLSTPTLHVRASEPIKGMEGTPPEAWRSLWPLPHTAVDVPGDHFTMKDHPLTARAVDTWLSSLRID